MPIVPAVPIKEACNDQDFYLIDQSVRGIAFNVHNELGRFMDERIYQAEIALRCIKAGLQAEREIRIRVSHDSFFKDYLLDLLIGREVIVELKTAIEINPTHRTQTLNYLFLCNLPHAILLNLRPLRVKHEFVSSTFSVQERRAYKIADAEWVNLSAACARLKLLIISLLEDWGTCLDTQLYREAVIHFFGGEPYVLRPVEIHTLEGIIGTQKMHLLTEDIAFSITALTKDTNKMSEHLLRLIRHTKLKAVAWINLNRNSIELRTVIK